MPYKTLIILSVGNFNKRISDLLVVQDLLKENIPIEYWDVSEIAIPGYKVHSYQTPDKLVTTKIANTIQLKENIISHDNRTTLYLIYMNYGVYSYSCYRMLTKMKCVMVYAINGCIPSIRQESRYKDRLRRLLNKNVFFEIKYIIKTLKCIFATKLRLIKPVDIVLKTCGNASPSGCCPVGPNTKYLLINSSDYQQVILPENEWSYQRIPYAVFLDQNIPFHPDNKMANLHFDPNDYYDTMNNFFCTFEEKFKMKVVIAAHPSCSEDYINKGYFQGRDIIISKTMEIVRDASIVISHNSTAVSFPVIFKKPILFVITRGMKRVDPRTCKYCELLSNLLGCSLLELSNNDNTKIPEKLIVDEEKYDYYKYYYLTNHETEYTSNSEVFKELLYFC